MDNKQLRSILAANGLDVPTAPLEPMHGAAYQAASAAAASMAAAAVEGMVEGEGELTLGMDGSGAVNVRPVYRGVSGMRRARVLPASAGALTGVCACACACVASRRSRSVSSGFMRPQTSESALTHSLAMSMSQTQLRGGLAGSSPPLLALRQGAPPRPISASRARAAPPPALRMPPIT